MAPAAMAKGETAAATYSFSSQPKAVSATRKYRNPGEVDTTMYRDLKETCITWDKRVHRGNTYSMYTQNAIKEALQDAARAPSPKAARRSRSKEPALFDMPLPEKERIAVDLTRHLVANEEPVELGTVEAQTDEFLPEAPSEHYQPQKTGCDVHTQVEDGELFNFDREVEPILNVLANKTLEQSIMEVEEEDEMANMKEFKFEWYQRQERMMKEWQAQVQGERVLWEKKEAVMKIKREEKRRECQVLLKIQAMAAAKQHLARLVPNAVESLQEVAFPDMKGMAINRLFLPLLLGQVQQEVQTLAAARLQADELVGTCVQRRIAAQGAALSEQAERRKELDRLRFEELQIRQGKIRIMVDDPEGGSQICVGPFQISSQDQIEQVQDRVYEWLQANQQTIAAAWPWGVLLCICGGPVRETAEIFDAKPGQISMVPKDEPLAQEEAAEETLEEEGGEGV